MADQDAPFGRLNPVIDSYSPNKARLNLSEPSFFNSVRDGLVDRFTPDVLAGNTEYKAITLKLLPATAGGGVSHWLTSVLEKFGAKTTVTRVIARIPELHAHLPLPRDPDDEEILQMYPVFEGAASNGNPTPGQIIRVTYQNIYNMSGPIYLGTLTSEGGQASYMATNDKTSGKEVSQESPGEPVGGSGALSTPKRLTELGAWSGVAAISNPKKTLEIMKRAKIDHIDVMINDGSRGAVERVPFHVRDRAKIVAMARMFQAAGIKVSLSTWACPTEDWIKGMKLVGEIATECNAVGVTLDLEEAWITPLKNKPQSEIFPWNTGLVGTLRQHFKGRIGVAPIVYASTKVLDDVFKTVDYIIPQCYSTTKNTVNLKKVGDLERITMARYAKYGKEVIMGQAAWNLDNAYHLSSPTNAIRGSLTASLEAGVSKVRYWRLEMMYGDILKAMHEFLEQSPNNV